MGFGMSLQPVLVWLTSVLASNVTQLLALCSSWMKPEVSGDDLNRMSCGNR